MRVLVAPDKFKGTLTGQQAARAIATGWRRTRPGDQVTELPLADGGEGTLEALVAALGGRTVTAPVTGPLGDSVTAAFGLAATPAGLLAIVEIARASGLALVPESRRDPLRSSTRGTGELILAATRAGARTVLLCLGGSATTDGGAGMASALGVRLLEADGADISPGGAGLIGLARIDASGLEPALRRVRFSAACDVDNPLVGPHGAARAFGPQKGATLEQVVMLERALGHFAAVIDRDLAVDVRSIPRGGAAGGLGAGLVAFLGARLRSGVSIVLDAVGFAERLADVDLVLTGEGNVDASSFGGKVVGAVIDAARSARLPAAVLCGRADASPAGVQVAQLLERFGADRSLGDTRRALEDLAAEVATRAQTLAFAP